MEIYYLDPETKTPTLWDQKSLHLEDNRIKREVLPNGKVVSTIFLSINHGSKEVPLFFECYVFPKEGVWLEIDGERTSTYEQILEVHKKMVEKHS